MSELFRRFPRSGRRAIVDWNTFDGRKDQYEMVCVSRGVLDVARMLVRTRGMWPTTYAATYYDNGYDILDSQQLDILKEYISEFLEATDTMNCDDFKASLDAISDAIANSQLGCGGDCTGTQGAGLEEAPADPFNDDGATPPAGYTDYDEYDDWKCDLAQYVLDRIEADINSIDTKDYDALTVTQIIGILVGLMLTNMSFVVLLTFANALKSIWDALSSFSSAKTDMLNYIANFDICLLYGASTASQAQTDIHADIDGETFTSDSETKDMLKAFFSFESINLLFGEKPTDINPPTGNCLSCQPVWWNCITGTIVDSGPDFVEVESVIFAGDSKPGIGIGVYESTGCVTLDLTLTAGTWAGHSKATRTIDCTGYESGGCGNGSGWDTNSPVENYGPHTNMGSLQLRSNSDFTLKITKS